jgi:DnaD/phage-associated family protein
MVNPQGWIKLHRVLIKKPIWKLSTPEQKTILITLLLMANHEETEWEWEGKKFKAKQGEFVTSINSIIEACGKGISFQNVRSALERFKKLEFLTYKVTKTGRLISVVNWLDYQLIDVEPNKATNKEVTKTQQRGNKEVTTNKNDKNVIMKEDNSSSGGEQPPKCYEYYQSSINLLAPAIMQEIDSFLQDGLTDELICAAIDEAVKANVRTWNYIRRVLANCYTAGVKDLQQFAIYQAERTQAKQPNAKQDKPERKLFEDV